MTDKHLTDRRFADLDLPDSVLRGVDEAGFKYCTPIQAQALPLALAGRDVAGQAQTGTGKTAAFLLAIFKRLLDRAPAPDRQRHQPRALVLAPTRELAIQIHRDAEILGRHTGLSLGLIYGGTGYDEQRAALEAGLDILIGTPGRVIDFYRQKAFDLGAIEVFVLDEADRMFDLGFIKDVRYVLRRMPAREQRLNMLFSATLSYRVTELAYEHMNDPQAVKIEAEKVTVERVNEVVYYPAKEEKIPLLIGLLREMDARRTIVFVNTKHAADRVWSWLSGNGFSVEVLSGDVPQRKREHLLQAFKDGKVEIVVATDVAARGLHIDDISHVVNFDLPQDPEDYVHRIGRTARAGASGDAISFACDEYAYSLVEIQDYIGHNIPTATFQVEQLEQPQPPVRRPRRERGRRGERPYASGRSRPPGKPRARGAPGRGKKSRPPRESAQREQRPDAGRKTTAEPAAAPPRPRGPDTPAVG